MHAKRIGTAGDGMRRRVPRRASRVRSCGRRIVVRFQRLRQRDTWCLEAHGSPDERFATAAAAFSGVCTGSPVSGDIVQAFGIVSGVRECSSSRTGPDEAPEKRCYVSTLGPSLSAPTL